MPVFAGNTSGAVSTYYRIPAKISSFSLVNKAAGVIGVNAYIVNNSVNVSIVPYNLSLAAGEAYISEVERQVSANNAICIATDGSLDYYFSID